MVPPASDRVLQDNLISIGRSAIIAAHESLLRLRNDSDWEVRLRIKHKELTLGKSLGLDPGDSTVDDYSAEDRIIESLCEEAGPFNLRVLTREEMLQSDAVSRKPDQHIIAVLGEEYMKPQNNPRWKGIDAICPACDIIALVDPLDGTVLRQRDLPNWCIAIVFYLRREGEVLAALVGQAIGDLYFATRLGKAFRQNSDYRNPVRAGRLKFAKPKEIKADPLTSEKHLAFVAQKPESFLQMGSQRRALRLFHRVYNLGGNPMLAKVGDGTMDAVIELKGQLAHDVVPGAFVARRAGATVLDLHGRHLDWREALKNPEPTNRSNRLSYVAATDRDLAQRVLRSLAPLRR